MKELILRNWTFMRALRLVLGIIIVVEAVMAKDVVFGIVGLLFSGMALLNTGCCGTGACYTPPVRRRTDQQTTKDISYEEVV
jgi:hypothetical protein